MRCRRRSRANHIGLYCALILIPLVSQAQERTVDDQADLSGYDDLIKQSDRDHWAFRPVRRPAVPTVTDTNWVRNPIDNFVLAELEKHGWRPSAPAAPHALLRRMYLDLVGLPPTPNEQAAFLQDSASTAGAEDSLNRIVNTLLSRPGYGERWARHWLDLVRYADSNGYEVDGDKAFVWRYRDWVIRSLNEDKPFDRFIVEQLAGDELTDASAETLVATGYYRLGPWDQEPADPQEDRFDQLDDIVRTTSEVFLGLSIGCARCHNHKFDPLTMHDYYRLVAIFNTLRWPEKGSTGFDHAELDLPLGSPAELDALTERDQQLASLATKTLNAKAAFRTEFLSNDRSKIPHDVLLAIRKEGSQRTNEEKDLVAKFEPRFNEELTAAMPAELKERIALWDRTATALRQATPDLPRGYFMHEPSPIPPTTRLLMRGKAARPGPVVAPGLPAVLVTAQPVFPPASRRTSQRRTALAHWIASKDNPLTARVIVNRVWYYHMGEGLVSSLSDFGLSGDRPTHEQLIDWLADWFVSEGWSLKKLHHLIISSNTYRMSKVWNPEYGAVDPENRRLWRVPYTRLDVEAIRDSMLSVSGNLNGAMYGPAIYPFVPREALAGHSDPEKVWPAFDEIQASRRTIYAFVKRSLIVPMIELLDFCDPSRSAPRRTVTSVAPQALSLLNGDFVNRQARHLSSRLVRESGRDVEKQIELAYLLTLCRPPTTQERTVLTQFLSDEAARLLTDSPGAAARPSPEHARQQALEQMCRAILNLNEFVYTD